jgi:hypothetical protein
VWVYVIVALCIALCEWGDWVRPRYWCKLLAEIPYTYRTVMIGIGVGLWLWHKKSREANRIKLEQYETEQVCSLRLQTLATGRTGEETNLVAFAFFSLLDDLS